MICAPNSCHWPFGPLGWTVTTLRNKRLLPFIFCDRTGCVVPRSIFDCPESQRSFVRDFELLETLVLFFRSRSPWHLVRNMRIILQRNICCVCGRSSTSRLVFKSLYVFGYSEREPAIFITDRAWLCPILSRNSELPNTILVDGNFSALPRFETQFLVKGYPWERNDIEIWVHLHAEAKWTILMSRRGGPLNRARSLMSSCVCA